VVRSNPFIRLLRISSTVLKLLQRSSSFFDLPRPSETLEFDLINSFRFFSFVDLPSLFSTVFDGEELIGKGDRIDDEQKVEINHGKNPLNYTKSYGHCDLAPETGLDQNYVCLILLRFRDFPVRLLFIPSSVILLSRYHPDILRHD
jgi:hypothetical protein